MGSVISDGLSVVLQWIELRRREIEEWTRQWSENTFKSFTVIHRRLAMKKSGGVVNNWTPTFMNRPSFGRTNMKNLVFGIPVQPPLRGGWLQRPEVDRSARLYKYWIQYINASHRYLENPGSQIYYFPGL